MTVLDSSVWIEYLTDGPNADAFEGQFSRPETLTVPSVVIVEVTRWLLSHGRLDMVDTVQSLFRACRVAGLDGGLAELAGRLGIERRLPLADGIIYATAQANHEALWTQDKDFEGLPGVRYFQKPSG